MYRISFKEKHCSNGTTKVNNVSRFQDKLNWFLKIKWKSFSNYAIDEIMKLIILEAYLVLFP